MLGHEPSIRSRRAVLGAALASATALVAQALGRPAPVRAGVDGDVVLGAINSSATTTWIENSASISDPMLQVVHGWTGIAIVGRAGANYGVEGNSFGNHGVHGHTDNGYSNGTAGVFGDDAGDTNSLGVWGQTAKGQGVRGQATSTGVGGYFTAPSTGVALQASGKVKLSRSGKTKIPAGRSSRTVSLAGVNSASLIFAVLASNRSGRWVRAIVPGSGAFAIYLNASVASDSYVSWFVLN